MGRAKKIGVVLMLLLGITPTVLLGADANKVDRLVDKLLTENGTIQDQVRKELISLGEKAIPFLQKHLKDEDSKVQVMIINILTDMNIPESNEILLKIALEEKGNRLGFLALEGLKSKGEKLSAGVISELLNNYPIESMLDMISEKEKDKKLVKFLSNKLLEEKNWKIKCKMARVLGKLREVEPQLRVDSILKVLENECKNPTSKEILRGSFITTTEFIKRQYVFALKDIGEAGIPILKEYLRDIKGELKQRVIVVLGLLREREMFPYLIDIILNATDGYLRAFAVRAIEELNDKRAIPVLKKALKDNFGVEKKSDVKPPEGYEHMNVIYPVRDAAYSALIHLGVRVKSVKWNEYEVVE